MDVHWIPIHPNCAVCQIKYDVIGKMETFSEDIQYIFQIANLTHLFPNDHFDLKTNVHNKNETVEMRVMKYFKPLDPKLVRRLYQFYHMDFKLFGYTIEYLN